MNRLASVAGILVFIGVAWLLSSHRGRFPWRVVIWGLGLQVGFALLILRTPVGVELFGFAQEAVARINGAAVEGATLVFGPLAKDALLREKLGPSEAPIFVILVSATIIVVSAGSSLLYHWGLLQRVVWGMAWVMRRAMKTSGSETLAATANIFIGQTEAPLLIRPYLPTMTRSELLSMMVGGMATIAGGVLAVYTEIGRRAGVANMAGHLIAASVLSAPAALLISKILMPETEVSETASGAPMRAERTAVNGVDALCKGASEGLMLALNVAAMLLAFVAMVSLANGLLGAVTSPWGGPLTVQQIFGWLNAPCAWLLGVPAKDCLTVGAILGERIVLNEFVAYLSLARDLERLDPRTVTLMTYALCGFANFGSVAIQIGGIGTLVPDRRKDLAQLGLKAMLGGLLACYLTACIVGVLL